MGRKIFIGDVHGCAEEFKELIEKTGFVFGEDQIYTTGDLINRGPDSKGAYELAKKYGAKCVMGNHEYHLIRDAQGFDVKRSWVGPFKEAWGKDFAAYLADIKSWPLYIEEDDFILVHGGLVPGVPLAEAEPHMLLTIRTWDGEGKDTKNPNNPPWFSFYKGEKLVIFGHWAGLEGTIQDNVIGLDTGCVYGKKLRALILPGREIFEVAAKAEYCPIDKSKRDKNAFGMERS